MPIFTKTFLRFFFGFVAIIGLAFGVLLFSNSQFADPVDNIAQPK